MMIFLVAIGIAGTFAAMAMVDDLVADLEAEAEAAREEQQAADAAQAEAEADGGKLVLPDWFEEAQDELNDLYAASEEQLSGPEADSEESMSTDLPGEPQGGQGDEQSVPVPEIADTALSQILAEFEAAEDDLAADLMIGSQAWAEDMDGPDVPEVNREHAVEGQGEPVAEDSPPLIITDFLPEDEVLLVEAGMAEELTLEEVHGDTQVMHGEDVLAVLEGVSGVSVEDILGTHHSDVALA